MGCPRRIWTGTESIDLPRLRRRKTQTRGRSGRDLSERWNLRPDYGPYRSVPYEQGEGTFDIP